MDFERLPQLSGMRWMAISNYHDKKLPELPTSLHKMAILQCAFPFIINNAIIKLSTKFFLIVLYQH